VKVLGNGALTRVVVGVTTAGVLGGVALYGEVRANSARTTALEHATVSTLQSIEALRSSMDELREQVAENNGYLRRLEERRR
jgi:hypothetical protein